MAKTIPPGRMSPQKGLFPQTTTGSFVLEGKEESFGSFRLGLADWVFG